HGASAQFGECFGHASAVSARVRAAVGRRARRGQRRQCAGDQISGLGGQPAVDADRAVIVVDEPEHRRGLGAFFGSIVVQRAPSCLSASADSAHRTNLSAAAGTAATARLAAAGLGAAGLVVADVGAAGLGAAGLVAVGVGAAVLAAGAVTVIGL